MLRSLVCVATQTEGEVERLTRLKAGRMKELVLKRRLELENICRSMHVEPDASTVPEKSIALIDSGTSSVPVWVPNFGFFFR
jgi:Ase1/PRC1/MAP65 family protein